MTTKRPSEPDVEVGPQGPTLTGTNNETLLQAMRNLWPILSSAGRREATQEAERITTLGG